MLFRKEVVEARQTRLYGQVLIATPISFWFVTAFLSTLIGALIVFLATASFARIETVPGAVVPSDGIVHVRAPGSGVLSEFDLQEGQSVLRGQVVGRITAFAAADDDSTRTGAQLASIATKIARLETRIEQSAIVTDLELTAKQREHVELTARIARQRDMLILEDELLAEAHGGFARIMQLSERDLVNAEAVSQQNVQLINTRQGVMRLRSEIDTLTVQRENIAFEQQETTARARLNELQFEAEREALQDERRLLMSEQAFDIIAPTSGTATAVLVSEGYDLPSTQRVFSILPEKSTLEVELYVPSRAIGFIERGQSVRLLIDAFPYQRFGAKGGRVAEVTSSVIMPGSQDLLVEIKEPVYRITVSLQYDTISAFDRDVNLQAGMLLSANIILEDRTILTWLLEPLLSVARRT